LHGELADLAEELGVSDVLARSYCDEWSIAQVFSHLGSGAEIGRDELVAALAGEGMPDCESIWARWDALEPADMVRGFAPSDARYLALVDDLLDRGALARDDLRIPLHGWSLDLKTFLVFRLLEVALHQWDVRVLREPAVEVDAEAAHLLLEAYPLQLVGGAADASVAERIGPARVRAEIADAEQAVEVVVQPPVLVVPERELPDAAQGLPVTTVAVPTAGAWCRWLSGRLDPAHTPPAVEVRGPVPLDDLRQLFPGV
jgi:hypothetical protein